MTYEIKKYKDISGIEKIMCLNPFFSWNDIEYIEKMEYSIEPNEIEERVSTLKVLFIFRLPNKKTGELLVIFNAINCFKLNNVGGMYNQIMGLEVIEPQTHGWEQEQRYVVRDYENGTIEFYCESIEIVSASSHHEGGGF